MVAMMGSSITDKLGAFSCGFLQKCWFMTIACFLSNAFLDSFDSPFRFSEFQQGALFESELYVLLFTLSKKHVEESLDLCYWMTYLLAFRIVHTYR